MYLIPLAQAVEPATDSGLITLRLISIVLLVIANGFFVAAEFALVGARRSKIEQLVAEGNVRAKLVLAQQNHLDRYIAASQLGITLASLLLGALAEPTFAALIEPPVITVTEAVFGAIPAIERFAEPVSHALGFAMSYFIVTTLHIVLGEQAPKVFAIRSAEQVALYIARPLQIFNVTFSLVIRFLDWLTALVLRLFGVRGQSGHHGAPTLEELRMMVQASGKGGVLEQDEQQLLINVFDFGGRAAYQVMVPRTEVATITATSSVGEFLDLFKRTGHTRFPALGGGGVDDVVGIISTKDLLVALSENTVRYDQPIQELIRPAFFRPATKRVADLMHEMQREHVKMAVLVDEYGGMAGIATLEDLVEEIVGELDDELDTTQPDVTTINERTFLVDGSMRVEEANEELKLVLPAGEYETVAGFILEQLGRLPTPTEQLNWDGLVFTVVEMQGPRIARVQIERQ